MAGTSGCFDASWTALYSDMLPAPGTPGVEVPALIASAVGSWASSWLATTLPFAVSAFASQS